VHGLCTFAGALCFSMCVTATLNMALLSFNRYYFKRIIIKNIFLLKKIKHFLRYMFVCYNHKYENVFSKTQTIVYCMITWLVAPIANILIIYMDAYHFDEKNKTCMFNRTFNRLLVSLSSGFGNFFSLLIL